MPVVITIVSGLLAGALVMLLWGIVGHAITIAHEGGHALAGVLLGRDVDGVVLKADRTGKTTLSGGGGHFLVSLAGYTAPSVFGIVGAIVLATGHAAAVLWLSVVLLVLLLITVDNWFGGLIVAATGALLALTAYTDAQPLQQFVAGTWIWLLLLGGLYHCVLFTRTGSDHATLRSMTHIPVLMWGVFFNAVAALALGFGAAIMLGLVDLPRV